MLVVAPEYEQLPAPRVPDAVTVVVEQSFGLVVVTDIVDTETNEKASNELTKMAEARTITF